MEDPSVLGPSELRALDQLEDLYTEDLDDFAESLTQHLSPSSPIQHTKFRPKSIFDPTFTKSPYVQCFYQVVYTDIIRLCQQSTTHTHSSSNLTTAECTALKDLTDNRHLVIRLADRGGGIVAQNRIDYQSESTRLLSDSSTYHKLSRHPLPIFTNEAHELVNRAAADGIVTASEAAFLKHALFLSSPKDTQRFPTPSW